MRPFPPTVLFGVVSCIGVGLGTAPDTSFAQSSPSRAGTVTGGSVTGGNVTGGSTRGGDVKGGDVKGGDVTGGNVTGGAVKGANVTGGSVSGGSVTGGTVTSGSVTAGTVGAGTATSTIDGREVSATAQGSVSVHGDGGAAVVTVGTHKLVVEKERLLIDGKERAKIPAAAVKVSIEAAKGRLTVRADGKEVLSTDLPSVK